MSRVFRKFSLTSLPAEVPPPLREAMQAVAQAIDQLTDAVNAITPAPATNLVTDGAKAGSFNGVFVVGQIAAANTPQSFFHKLDRVPAGAFELLSVIQPNVVPGAPLNIAAPIAVTAFDAKTITLTCTSALKVFTLIVL